MANVYGMSDSELSCLVLINSGSKQIKINSLKEYEHYLQNYKEEKIKTQERLDNQIQDEKDTANKCFYEIKQKKYDLNGIEFKIKAMENKVRKYYGEWKINAQRELEELRGKRRKLISAISSLNENRVDSQTGRDRLISEKNKTLYDFDMDIDRLFKLAKDEKLRNKIKGAVGENKLIDHLAIKFKEDNQFYLINGLNFDVIGKAININNSTKTEVQVDHLIVCKKGVFLLETKHWKDITNDFKKSLIEQMEKIKRTSDYVFDKKIKKEVIKFLLIGTEKKVDIKNKYFVSLRLDELDDYLESQSDILNKADIIIILNEISKFLPTKKFKSYPKISLKTKSFFIKSYRIIKKCLTKNKN
jgi:hypothetical protein